MAAAQGDGGRVCRGQSEVEVSTTTRESGWGAALTRCLDGKARVSSERPQNQACLNASEQARVTRRSSEGQEELGGR